MVSGSLKEARMLFLGFLLAQCLIIFGAILNGDNAHFAAQFTFTALAFVYLIYLAVQSTQELLKERLPKRDDA